MALRDSWRRALVFSGLVDDRPQADSDDYLRRPEFERPPAPALPPPPVSEPAERLTAEEPEPIVVRRLGAPPQIPVAERQPTDETARVTSGGAQEPAPAPRAIVAGPSRTTQRDVSIHRVKPRSFNDAQELADRYKAATPVVLDLQDVETDLAKRLIGFASGLTYGLDGAMERLHDRVFLLSPPGVEVPAPQRARLAAQGSLTRA
jgi:cell division inhibitor SepF